jgi:hypothetical protein
MEQRDVGCSGERVISCPKTGGGCPLQPGMTVGDTVQEPVSLIKMGMVESQNNRGRVVTLN